MLQRTKEEKCVMRYRKEPPFDFAVCSNKLVMRTKSSHVLCTFTLRVYIRQSRRGQSIRNTVDEGTLNESSIVCHSYIDSRLNKLRAIYRAKAQFSIRTYMICTSLCVSVDCVSSITQGPPFGCFWPSSWKVPGETTTTF